MKSSCHIVALLMVFIYPIGAQHGILDSTFNTNGKVITDFLNHSDGAIAGVLQSDGKIVVAGSAGNGIDTDFGVVRYNTNGSLDTTFGVHGKVITPIGNSYDHARSLKIQTDGKIVVAGISNKDTSNYFALIRYLPDGAVDSTFGIDGITILAIEGRSNFGTSLAIQNDGSMVIAGYVKTVDLDVLLARFNSDGMIDSTFGTYGKVITDVGLRDNGASAIAIQTDGKIVIGGSASYYPISDICLIRYHEDGSLDSTFSADGQVLTSISEYGDFATSLAIQPDGKIIAAGHTQLGDPSYSNYDFVVMRYNQDGTLDTGFGIDGYVITSFGDSDDGANSVAIQPDGKIVAVGQTSYLPDSDFALSRYHSDGTIDTTWGIDGKVTTDFNSGRSSGASVVIQPDGKIIALGGYDNGGQNDFALARYLSGLIVGVIDLSAVDDVLIYPNPVQEYETLEYTLKQDETLTIELFNLAGQLIEAFVSQRKSSRGTYRESLHFDDHMIPGIYFLRISTKNGSLSIKIIKQ